MNIQRPGKRNRTSPGETKFYITLLLIVGVVYLFWSNLKEDQVKQVSASREKIDYLPAVNHGLIYHKPNFDLSYVEEYEQPEWVAYRLTKEMMDKPNHPRDQEFEPDPAITTQSAHYHDYKQSGYTKGHLVPSADMSWDINSMNATFLMSNVSPMTENFNSGIWLELEHNVRDWAKEYQDIVVIAGPVFTDSLGTIGKNKVRVPSRFFKAIFTMNKGKPSSIGFLFSQKETNPRMLDQYIVSIDRIEYLTGLDLFANMYGSWENEIALEKEPGGKTGQWSFNPYWYQQRLENKH